MLGSTVRLQDELITLMNVLVNPICGNLLKISFHLLFVAHYRYLIDYQFSPETYHDYSYDSRQPAPSWYLAFHNYNTDRWTNLHVEGIFPRLLYIWFKKLDKIFHNYIDHIFMKISMVSE